MNISLSEILQTNTKKWRLKNYKFLICWIRNLYWFAIK